MKAIAPESAVLNAIYCLSKLDEIIDVFSITSESSLDLFTVLRSLEQLRIAGLVDARRLRLTLRGLAVAAASRGRIDEKRQLARRAVGATSVAVLHQPARSASVRFGRRADDCVARPSEQSPASDAAPSAA